MQAAAQSNSLSEEKEPAHQDAARSVSRLGAGGENSQSQDPVSEVARFGAIKEKKHSLEAGIEIFNR